MKTFAASGYTGNGGKGLHFLTGSITSPSLSAMMKQIMSTMPQAKWHVWEPAGGSGAYYATGASASYQFAKADRIVSLDSDWMVDPTSGVRWSRDWAQKRKVSGSSSDMSRMY